MAKVHLFQTENPLNDGDSVTTMCERVVFRSVIGAMCDAGEIPGVEVDSLLKGVCSKCQAVEWTDRYLYFVRESAEPEEND